MNVHTHTDRHTDAPKHTHGRTHTYTYTDAPKHQPKNPLQLPYTQPEERKHARAHTHL